MGETFYSKSAPQRVITTRRTYNSWVVDESIEDFALRYAPNSVRKWSVWTIINTSLAAISFLAMEAIGATLIWQYGFYNAFYALIVVSVLIFLTSWPISFYAAKYNIDIDLLTRGAGFGYIGSTITSLIYACFTFIFLAFESAIMALALELALNIPLSLGYLISALVILPFVMKGIGYINKVQLVTQPFWIILLLLPWFFIFYKNPALISETIGFVGIHHSSLQVNFFSFGAACTLLFALITQIGEQVDYLRFLPTNKTKSKSWLWAVFLGGPFWIVLGFFKILMGMLLMVLALKYVIAVDDLNKPTYLYWIAYRQVFDHAGLALFFMLGFVCLSQIKINITNAYAGSLAWSNFFARLTHSHPGRAVWLVFNIFIAILLMQFSVIHTVEKVLGLYSNIALAWIGAIVSDLIICKPLGLSPKGIEFRRAYLYDINPVGVGSFAIASIFSILCYLGLFGQYAEAFSGFVALVMAFVFVPLIAYLTKGKYYLARRPVENNQNNQNNQKNQVNQVATCTICTHEYELADIADCPAYHGKICSLCCSLEARCQDLCKPHARWSTQMTGFIQLFLPQTYKALLSTKITLYVIVIFAFSIILAICLSLVYIQEKTLFDSSDLIGIQHLFFLFVKIYIVLFLLLCVAAWWLILNDESRRKAEQESRLQTQLLIDEIAAHEITDLQLQEARIQAEKANEAKSRYLIGISHELRTPLNSILGYSQLLQKQEKISEQGTLNLAVINRSGQHLTSLIDDLLDLARIETGKISLNMTDINFANFSNQIIKMFEPQFKQKNLNFHIEISKNCPTYVRTDQKRLKQILINILGNAFKFTDHGYVRLKIDYRFQTAYFEIEDTGCGISEDDINIIFHPFERGKNVEDNQRLGTGLGLPIVKLLVDLLGGELSLSSQMNKGTVVKIKLFLPSKTVTSPAVNTVSHDICGYQGGKKRILVVDNESVDRELMTNFLNPLGFLLAEAESGLECLSQLAYFKPDLILMNLTMPVMSGWETCQIIKKNHMSNAPIIMISANALSSIIDIDKNDLNDNFLMKPLDLNGLLHKIGTALALTWHYAQLNDDLNAQQKSSFERSSNEKQQVQKKEIYLKNVQKTTQFSETIEQAFAYLQELSHQGYIRGIKEHLSYNQKKFPEYDALWNKLLVHVQCFDLNAIQYTLESYKHES